MAGQAVRAKAGFDSGAAGLQTGLPREEV